MPCTLDKILEALDERLEKLNANLKSCKEEARDCLAEMKEVKRLINDLHHKIYYFMTNLISHFNLLVP